MNNENGFNYDIDDKKEDIIINKDYSFCKSMVYAIQAITGEQTHDILAMLVEKGDELFKAHDIDITEPQSTHDYNRGEKKKRDYIYYPGTKLYLGVYVSIVTKNSGYVNDKYVRKEFNSISYNFKLPQTFVRMSNKQFDDIAVDGMLTDSSFDFSKPNLKRPLTPTEKQEKYDQKRAIAKAKREIKAAAKTP